VRLATAVAVACLDRVRAPLLVLLLAAPALADDDRIACKRGDVDACFELADRLPWHDGGPTQEARDVADRAIHTLQRRCERGHVASCSRLTFMPGWRDHAFELTYARAACTLGDGQGCADVADDYDMAYDDDSIAKALALRRAACKHGHSWSCIKVAQATTDRASALRLYERACTLDAGDCLWLADQLADTDPRRRELIDRAAAAGVRRGTLWSTPSGGGFIPE
jgi:TPR repeat protein